MAPPAQTLTDLQEQIQQLTTTVQALSLQKEDYNNKVNPFAEHEENSIIIVDQGFNFELPEFHGRQSAKELLDWITTVEETLEFKTIPLDRCVPMIAMRFRSNAAAWWSQLKASRARLGKPKILSWIKLKKKMLKTFLPFNYEQLMLQRLNRLRQGDRSVEEYYTEFFSVLTRLDLQDSDQQIMSHFIGGLWEEIRDHLNLLNPLTLSEAYQKAITLEAQIREKFWKEKLDILTIASCLMSLCLVVLRGFH